MGVKDGAFIGPTSPTSRLALLIRLIMVVFPLPLITKPITIPQPRFDQEFYAVAMAKRTLLRLIGGANDRDR